MELRSGSGRPLSLPPIPNTIAILVAAVAFLATASPCRAVEPGDRVRVTILARDHAPDTLFLHTSVEPGARYVGSLLLADTRSIQLRHDDSSRTIPREVVAQFEESRGRTSAAGRGALIGALVGAAYGIALIAQVEEDDEGLGTGVALVGGAGGVAVGCGLGALVGSLIRKETWSPAESMPPGGAP